MMKKTLVLLATLLSTNVVEAGFTDGNELFEWLQEKEKTNGSGFKTGLYNGYIGGVVDLGNDVLFCTPAGVTRGQFTDVVTKYLKNNPEKRHQSADVLVTDAMKESFPCRD